MMQFATTSSLFGYRLRGTCHKIKLLSVFTLPSKSLATSTKFEGVCSFLVSTRARPCVITSGNSCSCAQVSTLTRFSTAKHRSLTDPFAA